LRNIKKLQLKIELFNKINIGKIADSIGKMIFKSQSLHYYNVSLKYASQKWGRNAKITEKVEL
jgi:hypothetical protein